MTHPPSPLEPQGQAQPPAAAPPGWYLPVPARPGPPEAWQPRPHPQLLRGPGHRWWRPLASFGIVLGGGLVLFVLLVVVGGVAFFTSSLADPSLTEDEATSLLLTSWWGLLANNLFLAALIPLSVLAVWAAHQWRPRWVSSVAGGLRWRWMLLAGVVVLVPFGALQVAFAVLDGWSPSPPEDVVLLLLVVALTTPLQAAGEEYLFRGWLTQAIGSLFARAAVGALVAGLVSATLFALAHGTGQGPWLFLDRFAFGAIASYLVWRTGGLEAAIALHAVNNMVIFVPTILSDDLEAALTVSDVPLGSAALDVALLVAVSLVLLWLARRRGVQRLFVPPGVAAGGGHASPAFVGPSGLR